MSHVFISHVAEDQDAAVALAAGLEAAGITAWYYERDCAPGASYLLQTGKAIEECAAVILLISTRSVGSSQVTKEVVRAHEADKHFIPVLCDLSHPEFQKRQPEWREALGSAVAVSIPPEGAAALIPRILVGLKTLGIASRKTASRPEPAAPPPARRSNAPLATGFGLVLALAAAGWHRWGTRPQEPAPVVVLQPPAQVVAPPIAEPETAAKLSLEAALLYRGSDHALHPVKPGMTLTSLSNYALYLRAEQDCHAYVYQVDARGVVDRLFPNDAFHTGDNLLKAGEERWVPNDAELFVLDENKGTETLYVAASRKPLPDLYAGSFAAASDLQAKLKTLKLMGVKGTARADVRRARPLKGKAEDVLPQKLKAAGDFFHSISFEHR